MGTGILVPKAQPVPMTSLFICLPSPSLSYTPQRKYKHLPNLLFDHLRIQLPFDTPLTRIPDVSRLWGVGGGSLHMQYHDPAVTARAMQVQAQLPTVACGFSHLVILELAVKCPCRLQLHCLLILLQH
ncbi:unnamed protein product [Pleuronectes platessa]|uniref:Uncharacterized protein n=1 Tax=Pleuronectes platessa TaxID=8262 RepID=A0A9N7VYT1_PLEPL|nr:unnamed protein product [Pleuronectes platessa]